MKTSALVMAAVLVTALVFGCTKGYQTEKPVNDVKITLTADRYPLVKGDNALGVKVADMAGKAVSDAAVTVKYYMPAMPGMAPMEYTTQATPKGSDYAFGANIPMEGGWKVDVTVAQAGKPAATATFNMDAR